MGAMTTGNRRFHEVGNNLVQHGAELQYIWGVRLRMQNQPYLNPAHLAPHEFSIVCNNSYPCRDSNRFGAAHNTFSVPLLPHLPAECRQRFRSQL